MKSVLIFVCLVSVGLFTSAELFAQRDAPVWDSHLTRAAVYRSERLGLNVDLVFKKNGGPIEHTQHQLDLYACLDSDLAAIMKVAQREDLLDKKSKDKQFLDVLLEAKLLTKLESKVARRLDSKPADKTLAPELQGPGAFQYEFKFTNKSLFESVGNLPSFDKKKTQKTISYEAFDDKFRIIAFVPVNDSKYSTKVGAKIREQPDFAHFMDLKTPILYFKPLSQRFQFNRIPSGEMLIYID